MYEAININLSNSNGFSTKIKQIQCENDFITKLLTKNKTNYKKNELDNYLSTDYTDTYPYYLYTSVGTVNDLSSNYVSSEEMWYALNYCGVTTSNDKFNINGNLYTTSDISKIDEAHMSSACAVNNVITLNFGEYYSYTSSAGNTWAIQATSYDQVRVPNSEQLYAGANNLTDYEEAIRYADFIGALNATSSTVLLYMEFSTEEVQDTLADLGIEYGFFTVNVGNTSHSFYYSHDGKVHALYEYDAQYAGYTQADKRN